MDHLTFDDGEVRPVRVSARLRSKIDPEDIHQEAIVKVLTSARNGNGAAKEWSLGYLRSARRSALLNAAREFGYAARDISGEARLDDLGGPVAADQTSPSGRAMRNESLARLAEALATLPQKQRLAVTLHHLDRLSLADTAARLGTTGPAVAGLLQRGLKALYQRLGESGL
jgi:RNA polymerase sigma-70 factor, ECF subfamily